MPVDLTPIILSGVLDNTTRDTIRLELHVPFIKEPIRFSLSGNCLRDAAGRKVEFRRKEEMPPASLRHVPLYGLLSNLLLSDSPLLAGDMTLTRRASRTADPSVIPNLLSIEFFEGSQRRYLIEGDCFSFHVSKPAWKCTQSCESAQEILNMSVLRDMIHVQVNQFRGSFYNELGDDMPSCKWDRVLNRAEAYLVAAEMVRRKYATHPRRRLAEAFVLDQVDSLNKWATLDEEGTDITPAASTKWEFTDFMKPAEVRRVHRALATPAFCSAVSLSNLVCSVLADRASYRKGKESRNSLLLSCSSMVTQLLSTIMLAQQKRFPVDTVATRLHTLSEKAIALGKLKNFIPRSKRESFYNGTQLLHSELNQLIASLPE